MSKASRDKGKRGEREVAQLLTYEGFKAKRFGYAQTNGGEGGADVVVESLPWLHIEVKRYKKFMGSKLRDALNQANHDRKPGTIPTVFHREDNCPMYCTLEAKDFLRIIRGME